MNKTDRPALDEIEITPEMIEAGLRAYREWDSRVEEPEGLIISVLEAALANPRPSHGPDQIPPLA